MNSAPHHRTIQRRIGLTLFVTGLAIAGYNLLRVVGNREAYTFTSENVFNALTVIGIAVLVLIISRVDHPSMRLVQVAVFAIVGFAVIWWNEPFDMTGMAFVVYAIFLAIQYSFLETYVVPKLAVFLALTLGVIITGTLVHGELDILASIAGVTFIAFYLFLLWIAFGERLKEYVTRAKDLELEKRKNAVFVRFGKNAAGLVHNLRNMLTVLYGLNELVKLQAKSKKIKDLVERQKSAFDRMAATIERTLTVVKAKQETGLKTVDLNELVGGVADFYTADLEFTQNVKLDLLLSDQKLMVEVQPLELCEVIENLIKNSWESLSEMNASEGNLIEIRTFDTPSTGFSVRDNGPGIPGLKKCKNDECQRYFRIGHSSKESGTGLGIPFVLEASRANNWDITISSDEERGTITTLLLNSR